MRIAFGWLVIAGMLSKKVRAADVANVADGLQRKLLLVS